MNQFDDIIRGKLDQLDANFEPRGWEKMSSMLDHMDTEMDEAFDAKVKSRLSSTAHVPCRVGWTQMRDWLDFSEDALEKLQMSKLSEVGLMILAVLCLFVGDYLPKKKPTVAASSSYVAMQSHQMSDRDVQINERAGGVSNATKTSSSNTAAPHATDNRSGITTLEAAIQNITEPTAPLQGNLTTTAVPAVELATSLESAAPITSVDQTTTGALLAMSGFSDEGHKNKLASSSERHEATQPLPRKVMASIGDDHVNEGVDAVADSRTMGSGAVVSQVPSLTMGSVLPMMTNTKLAPTLAQMDDRRWSLSLLSSIDFNQIRTPFDAIYERAGYSQHKIGYGGGALVQYDISDKFGISSGVLFSAKRYNPREFIELFKETPIEAQEEEIVSIFELQRIELNLVTLPLHLVRNIPLNSNWTASARAGASIQLALNAIYGKSLSVKRLDVNEFVQRNPGTRVTVGEESRFDQRRFPDGLLGSGSLDDNVYVSLDFGMGIERRIGQHGGVFLQPAMFFNAFNRGLSANDDKIHIYSLQAGYRMQF